VSAAVLPFTGKWQGRFETKPIAAKAMTRKAMAEARASHDARLIRDAKRDRDDWVSRMVLAMLNDLPSDKMRMIEFRLLGQNLDCQGAVQALALVQYQNGDKAHRDRVSMALEALAAMEAE